MVVVCCGLYGGALTYGNSQTVADDFLQLSEARLASRTWLGV